MTSPSVTAERSDVTRAGEREEVDLSQSRKPTRPFIVAGYDGTTGAISALRWALAEAKQTGTDLHVVRGWKSDDELAKPGLVTDPQQLVDLAHDTLPLDAVSGRIFVGFDGSKAGWRALRWAADEARMRHATLEMVLVYDIGAAAVSFGLAAVDSPMTKRLIGEHAFEAITDAADEIRDGELVVHALSSPGRSGPVLIQTAEGADLLVIGSTGHNHFTEWLLGSAVGWCLLHAVGPIAIVPDRTAARN